MSVRPRKFEPHEYQKKCMKFMLEKTSGGLFLDPGMGKTAITYGTFNVLLKKGYAKRMLVIAPLRPALSVWPREQQKWTEFGRLRVAVLHGPNKLAALDSQADVYVINPEGLEWLFSTMRERGWWWDILVVDESTKFKHTNTQRFKTLRPHLHKFRYRYILTGTPAPNGLLDLFGQVFIIDLGRAFGPYVTAYRRDFFYPSGYGGYTWLPKADTPQRINDRLKPLVVRLAAEDYLTLPPLIVNDVRLEMPEEALRLYHQMEALLFAELQGNRITAANAAAATIKCRQLANGGIYTGEAKEWQHVHTVKAEAAAEIVEELSGKPALIAYEFQHDLERLQAVFPHAPHLGGGVTPKQQRSIEDAWNAGKLPVLLAQPQSVAHGLNLQGTGAAIIFHSLTWDLEVYDQFIRRVWRQGQEERVVVHRLLMEDTVDYVIREALKRKDHTQTGLLDSLRMYLAASNRGVTYEAKRRALEEDGRG